MHVTIRRMAPRWHPTKDGGEVRRERRPEPPARRVLQQRRAGDGILVAAIGS